MKCKQKLAKSTKKRSIIFIWSITVIADDTEITQKIKQSRKQPKKAAAEKKMINIDEKKIIFFVDGIEIEVFSSESGLVRSESIFLCVCVLYLFQFVYAYAYYSMELILFFILMRCFVFFLCFFFHQIYLLRWTECGILTRATRAFFFLRGFIVLWLGGIVTHTLICNKIYNTFIQLALKKTIWNKNGFHETWNWANATIIISFC